MKTKNFKIWLIIWRIVLICLVLLILIWLINRNLFSSGTWLLERNFCQSSRVISDLYPKERAEKENCGFRLISEPVYFKVRLPVMFERVRISLLYMAKDNSTVSLGLMRKRFKPTDWQLEMKDSETRLLGDKLFESKTEFFINSGFINDYNLEFIISAPKVKRGAYLEIKRIKLELIRQPLTWQEVLSRGLAYLNDLF